MTTSILEARFIQAWQVFAPESCALIREYRFDPVAKFRFDFYHEAARVAVELDGGTWSGGRHTRPKGFEQDCRKFNLAARHGIAVLRYTTTMMHDPEAVVNEILELIEMRLNDGKE